MNGREPTADVIARVLCERLLAGDDPLSLARRYGINPADLAWIVTAYTSRTAVDPVEAGSR